MSKKLAAKASLIQAPLPPSPSASPTAEAGDELPARPKTAPGSMALFMASQSAAVREAEELREKLKVFDQAKPVRLLDPQLIRPSRWANRHSDSFADPAFAELKTDIGAAGGNVQPISVRPAPPVLNGSTSDNPPAYELVYGHRRHRACLELGLPVQALVTEMSDQALFQAMERENRARKNLSAWEQGTMYKRALDEGLYPSQRRLAEALSVDVSIVSKSLSLARLPDAVVAAFASPLDIQFRWAQPLADALQKDPDGVLARAARLKRERSSLSPAQVLAALVAPAQPEALNRSTPARQTIAVPSGRSAIVARDAKGKVTVEFPPGVVSPESEGDLAALLKQWLAGELSPR